MEKISINYPNGKEDFNMRIHILMVVVLIISTMSFLSAKVAIATDFFPDKEVRVIVNYGVGSDLDRIARTVQRFLPDTLGKRVIVENHQGAAGKIGLSHYLKQPKDGYAIFCSCVPAISIIRFRDPTIFEMEDLAVINVMWTDPVVIFTRKGLNWDSLDDMIHAINKEPGKYSYGVGGQDALGTVVAKLMFKHLNLNVKMIPYSSKSKAWTALRDGHIDMNFSGVGGAALFKWDVIALGAFWHDEVPGWLGVKPVFPTLIKYGVKDFPKAADYRFFAVHKEVKEKHPERFAKLVDSFHMLTTEHQGFMEFCEFWSAIGHDWFGPEKSTEILKLADKEFIKMLKNTL